MKKLLIVALCVATVALSFSVFAFTKTLGGDVLLGGGGSVPSAYSTTLSAPLTSSGTTISVASVTLDDATALTTALIYPGIFLVIEPGSSTKREIVYCPTVSSLTFTGCTRGLSSIGTSMATVTAEQQAHNSGVSIIAADPSQFYTYTLMNRWADQWVEGKHHNKSATSSDRTGFSLGDGTATDIYLVFSNDNSTSTQPYIKWDNTNDYFVGSGDGVSSIVFGGSTASTTAGKNLDLTTSVMSLLTTIYQPTIYASSTNVSGELIASSTLAVSGAVTSSNIYPWTNSSFNLGAFDFAWNNVYASGTAYFDEISVTSTISNFGPKENDTYHLGAYDNAWSNIYTSGTLYGASAEFDWDLTVEHDFFSYGDTTIGSDISDAITVNGYIDSDVLSANIDLGGYVGFWKDIYASGTLQMGSNDNNTTSTFSQSVEISGNIGHIDGAGATTTIAGNLQVNEDLNVTGDIMMNGSDVWKHEYISSESDTTGDPNTFNFTAPAGAKYALMEHWYHISDAPTTYVKTSNMYIDSTTGGKWLSQEGYNDVRLTATWNTTSTPVNVVGTVPVGSTYKSTNVIIYWYK